MNASSISDFNFDSRRDLLSCEMLGITVSKGDICYIDFGSNAYKLEIGLQHFGLVLSKDRGKIFVVPMTSKREAIEKSRYDRYLYRLPKLDNMKCDSALFLNDAKWINSARVIGVMAHLPCGSLLFDEIKSKVIQIIKEE